MMFRYLLRSDARRFLFIAMVMTVWRVVALQVSTLEIGPDEGQYWFWAKHLDFGYYSKPPLIAWTIAATTALFGEAEWAIRLAAPLYQLGASAFIFALCRKISDDRAAFWAGVAWLTLPGVFLSSALITTDGPLLFFWCAALYFFFALADEQKGLRKLAMSVALGAAIGLGFLSKYAMTYFLLGAALAIVVAPSLLRRIGLKPLALAFAVALAVFAPNIAWNAAHDFQTVSHTAANANWGGHFGHPDQLIDFLVAQIGIAGPILIAIILFAIVRPGPATYRDPKRALIAFAAPAFLIVATQAFISRAHGNWAAVSYPSLVILAAIASVNGARMLKAMKASIILHLIIGGGFILAFVNQGFADGVGASGAFKKLRGWRDQGAAIAEMSRGYDLILTDDREITGELVYYARYAKPIAAFDSNNRIDSHFEAFYAYDPSFKGRVLYVTAREDALYVQGRFGKIARIGAASVRTGKMRIRTLHLFEVADPLAR